jgi:hypothetical protein
MERTTYQAVQTRRTKNMVFIAEGGASEGDERQAVQSKGGDGTKKSNAANAIELQRPSRDATAAQFPTVLTPLTTLLVTRPNAIPPAGCSPSSNPTLLLAAPVHALSAQVLQVAELYDIEPWPSEHSHSIYRLSLCFLLGKDSGALPKVPSGLEGGDVLVKVLSANQLNDNTGVFMVISNGLLE